MTPQASHILSAAEQSSVAAFKAATDDYVKKERSIIASGQKLKPTKDIAELEQRRKGQQTAIRASRSDARQGDIFTPAAETLFHKLLRETKNGPAGTKLQTTLKNADPAPPSPLAVNAVFPNRQGQPLQSAPLSLLKELPPLPKGLEYRLVGSALVLRDTEANLVVDFLPDAMTIPVSRSEGR